MKVLTIKQPWASLIIHGHKKIETRGWIPKNPKLIEQIKKEGLLIHAGSAKPTGDMYLQLQNLTDEVGLPHWETLPYGAIIGKVTLEEMYSIDSILDAWSCNDGSDVLTDNNGITLELSRHELVFGDYDPKRYAWLLSNPIIFDAPIPCKGQLGLWNYEFPI